MSCVLCLVLSSPVSSRLVSSHLAFPFLSFLSLPFPFPFLSFPLGESRTDLSCTLLSPHCIAGACKQDLRSKLLKHHDSLLEHVTTVSNSLQRRDKTDKLCSHCSAVDHAAPADIQGLTSHLLCVCSHKYSCDSSHYNVY